jgi:hypothetical protein
MTLPNRLEYDSFKDGTHDTKSPRTLQDAIRYCKTNVNLMSLRQTEKIKKLEVENISKTLFTTISKEIGVMQQFDTDNIYFHIQELESKEIRYTQQINEIHTKYKKHISQYKISNLFKQQLQKLKEMESKEKKYTKNIFSKDRKFSKKQLPDSKTYGKLKYLCQRVKLKSEYLTLCQDFCSRLDINDKSKRPIKIVVLKDKEEKKSWTDARVKGSIADPMERWSTKRFQKRKNLPQVSRQILRCWIDEHLENPHPNDNEKEALAKAANITVEQVCNWFVNARVRYVPKQMQTFE